MRQAEAGTPVEEICRKMGVSEPTFYRWKKQFAGMRVAEIRRLKQLEEENRKLKQLVADLTLEGDAAGRVAAKMVAPSRRRSVVEHLRTAYRVSERRACRATGFHRSTQRYRTRRDPQVELRMRLKELAAARVRYGYRRLHVLLRREGWPVNAKRVHRLYREEGLSIRPKIPKGKRAWRYRRGRPAGGGASEGRGIDLMSAPLLDRDRKSTSTNSSHKQTS